MGGNDPGLLCLGETLDRPKVGSSPQGLGILDGGAGMGPGDVSFSNMGSCLRGSSQQTLKKHGQWPSLGLALILGLPLP